MPSNADANFALRGRTERKACAQPQIQRLAAGDNRAPLPSPALAESLQLLLVMSGSPSVRAASVLIVDGEARSSHRLAKLLREDGFEVEVLRDGRSALHRLAHVPPIDALITELSLPVSDGAAVARFACSRNPNVTIVVLTRHPNLLNATHFAEKVPLVLTKPLDYGQLLEVLGATPHGASPGGHLASPRF